MEAALSEAKKAFDMGEVPVGAVVTLNNEIIARAHNQVETLSDPTAHAETLAIKSACNKLGRWRLNDCQMFVTLEPCTMCTGAIKQARLSEVYFALADEKTGACGSLYDVSGENVKVRSGLFAEESKVLLGEFFKKLRDKNHET